MERAEPVHTAARVLRRHDLYYISRLHDNVLRHIFILQKPQLFLYISFFVPTGYATICTNTSSHVDIQTSGDIDASRDPGLPKLVSHQMSTLRLLHS